MTSITVGFPVYNGASTIERSIRCILEGTFRDIEVLVSDNGSTDSTFELVSRIAESDERVRVVRQATNLGAVGNFRYLAEQAKSECFLWRAHDDLSDPDYLEKLHSKLTENTKAVLAVSNILTTKVNRKKHRPFSARLQRGETAGWGHLPHVHAAWVYGLFRTDFARKSIAFTQEEFGHLYGCDMIMLLHALLDGGVVGTNDTTFNQISLVKGKPEQQADKALRRKIVSDFYQAAEKLADEYGVAGIKRQIFRLQLWRYIFARVVRWQKLI